MPCSLPGIFSNKDNFLKFVTKTIPIKKGSMHIATIPVPAETQEHTSKMHKRIAPSSFQKCTPELRTDCRAIKITKPSSSVPTTFATYSNLTTQSNTMDKDLTVDNTHHGVSEEIQHCFAILEDEIQKWDDCMTSIEYLCCGLKLGQDKMNHYLELISRDMYDSPSRAGKFSKLSS